VHGQLQLAAKIIVSNACRSAKKNGHWHTTYKVNLLTSSARNFSNQPSRESANCIQTGGTHLRIRLGPRCFYVCICLVGDTIKVLSLIKLKSSYHP
jgi:hypothetical protein